jgi:hypothetical protein
MDVRGIAWGDRPNASVRGLGLALLARAGAGREPRNTPTTRRQAQSVAKLLSFERRLCEAVVLGQSEILERRARKADETDRTLQKAEFVE